MEAHEWIRAPARENKNEKLYVKFELKVLEKNKDIIPEKHVGDAGIAIRQVNSVINLNSLTEDDEKFGYSNRNGEIGAYTTSLNNYLVNNNITNSYEDILVSVYIHEIGHNLGGVHKDPGNTMDYFTPQLIASKYNSIGSASSITNSNNIEKTINLSKLDAKFVKAVIGRINQNKLVSPTYNKYLTEKQKQKVEAEEKTGELMFWPRK